MQNPETSVTAPGVTDTSVTDTSVTAVEAVAGTEGKSVSRHNGTRRRSHPHASQQDLGHQGSGNPASGHQEHSQAELRDRRRTYLALAIMFMVPATAAVAGGIFMNRSAVLQKEILPGIGMWGHDFLRSEFQLADFIHGATLATAALATLLAAFACARCTRTFRNRVARFTGAGMIVLSLISTLPVFHVLLDAHLLENREKSQRMARTMVDAIGLTVLQDGGSDQEMAKRLAGDRKLTVDTAHHAFAFEPLAGTSDIMFVRYMKARSTCSPVRPQSCQTMMNLAQPNWPDRTPEVDDVRMLAHLFSVSRRPWNPGSLAIEGSVVNGEA